MDTFEAAPGEHSPSDTVSVSTYDVSGQKTKRCQVESFVQDIEASPIEEYKAPPFQ